MSSFSSLMALSRSQTHDQQASVQKALLERQRKEQEQKKRAQEQEKRQKELDQKLLLKHFEDEKKEKERQRKREEEEKAREAARQRRAEEQKNNLLYGPKKASKMNGGSSSASSSQSRDGSSRKKRMSDDEDDAPAGLALTREELRERKLQAALKKAMGTSSRSTISRTYHRPGGKLPGGAVDTTSNPLDAGSSSSGRSVRERLAAMPNTLTKLNTNKRDTRTIDEILQDRAKAKELKTLDGEEAKEFTDWFGDAKKDKLKFHAASTGTTPRANTPLSSSPAPTASLKQSSIKRTTPPTKPLPARSSLSSSVSKATSRSGSADRERPSMTKTPASKLSATSSARPSSVPSFKKKRPRSPTPERYPAKRRASPPSSSRHKRREYSEELDDANVSNMIWEIMGKRRSDYVHDDIFSDEEDMEAGASDLEREEKMSARIAKREDLIAQEAEKKREEEKRRRKKERERGY